MKKLGAIVIVSMVLCVCILLTTSPISAQRNNADIVAGSVIYGGVLRLALNKNITTLNPVNAQDTQSWSVLSLIYDSLAVYDKNSLAPVPWLANDWRLEGDTNVIVHLRQNVRWHDWSITNNHVLKAEDVVYTYKTAMLSNPKFADAISHISDVVAIDDYTVKFVLRDVYAPFFSDVLTVPLLPKNFVPPDEVHFPIGIGPFKYGGWSSEMLSFEETIIKEAKGTYTDDKWSKELVHYIYIVDEKLNKLVNFELNCSGNRTTAAYILPSTSYQIHANGTVELKTLLPAGSKLIARYTIRFNTIVLHANENYFSARPYIDEIRYYVYPTTKGSIFSMGQKKLHCIMSPLTISDLSEVDKQMIATNTPMMKSKTINLGFYYMVFNLRKSNKNGYLNDIQLRQAIALCVDKEATVAGKTSVALGYGEVAASPISSANRLWHNPNVTQYTMDWQYVGIGAEAKPPQETIDHVSKRLHDAGYIDINGDGYREMSDGSPLELEFLMPEDFLDTRSKIANKIIGNMGEGNIGLHAIRKTATDAEIEERLANGTFDIYIGYYSPPTTDPGYLYDLFHSRGTKNWAGYVNPSFDSIISQANSKMDISQRVELIKRAQAIIAADIPMDIIYYDATIESYVYRPDTPLIPGYGFDGWVTMPTGIGNIWTFLGIHTRPLLNVALSVPSITIYSGQNISVSVSVTDVNERPVPNADVVLSVAEGTLTPVHGQTNAAGLFTAAYLPPVVNETRSLNISVSVTADYMSGYACKQFTVHPAMERVEIELKSALQSLKSGEETTITVTVRSDGQPLVGATVSLITNLPAVISPSTATTDSSGSATFNFKSTPNTDTDYFIFAKVQKDGFSTQSTTHLKITVKGGAVSIPGFETIAVVAVFAAALLLGGVFQKRRQR